MIKPAVKVSMREGDKYDYHGVTIAIDSGGNLKSNGTIDPLCIQFNYQGASGARCFAVRVGSQVWIFEGPQIGRGMLEKDAVLAACRG